MKWKKLGRIFKPNFAPWAVTHGQNPFPEHIEGDLYKIHFAPRDEVNRARGAFILIDMKDPFKILEISKEPTLDLGEPGCFDDSGIMPSCIVNNDGKKYLYYTGWSKAVVTPFTFFIGLMISEDNGKTYKRYSKAPVLGRNINDPFLTCSPWVMIENNLWKMWYVSGTKWEVEEGNPKPKHYYHICYAESEDGINWKTGTTCIDYVDDDYAIARPVVIRENDKYRMWYCYRGGPDTYRAGYAESEDGKNWIRKDDIVGIDVSEDKNEWDSEMICYPAEFTHNGKKYLLYNGNKYGETGIGLAILEKI